MAMPIQRFNYHYTAPQGPGGVLNTHLSKGQCYVRQKKGSITINSIVRGNFTASSSSNLTWLDKGETALPAGTGGTKWSGQRSLVEKGGLPRGEIFTIMAYVA